MKLKPQWISILVVGLSFGTAWAIRGQFGHEQGAAWAGAIGGLSVILAARRSDWYRNMLMITLSSAVGWGFAGIISYGAIAGKYAQSDNFTNTYYGLMMLFVIGALYGLVGGGLVGLSLGSSKKQPVNWPRLITEMAVGGIVVHALLIDQLEILMTPPRSEAWAISLGAGLAMLWYMARNKHNSPIRVALFAALGGGFGFAFGEFFHILMNWIQLPFNTWNMAEYSIGFFGGIGMAYGIFSSKWENETAKPLKWENAAALLFLTVLIPLIIFRESFTYSMFLEKYKDLANGGTAAFLNSLSACIILLSMSGAIWYFLHSNKESFTARHTFGFFLIYTLAYILLSYISTGLFLGTFLKNSNHHLYLVNLLVVILLLRRKDEAFSNKLTNKMDWKTGLTWIVFIIFIFAILALITIHLHGPTDASYDRFPI